MPRSFWKTEWERKVGAYRKAWEHKRGPLSSELSTVITREMKKAFRDARISGTPVIVPVRPFEGSVPDDCYDNIEEAIPRLGKAHAPGWRVEQHKLFFVFHAHDVLRTEANDLVDVTPQLRETDRIVFVSDASQKWRGKPNPSRYVARSKRSSVIRYANLQSRLSKLYSDAWQLGKTQPQIDSLVQEENQALCRQSDEARDALIEEIGR